MKQTNLRNHVRKIAIFLTCAALVLVQAMPASAADWQEPLEYASYDMSVGGTQTFHIIDEDGEESVITVTELPSTSRVANGAYQIKHTKTGCWNAGFKISITNNCIVSAYGKFYETYTGEITNDVLQLNNNKQATYQFYYHKYLTECTTGVRCTIENNAMKVYPL